jgi:hypothetical protein
VATNLLAESRANTGHVGAKVHLGKARHVSSIPASGDNEEVALRRESRTLGLQELGCLHVGAYGGIVGEDATVHESVVVDGPLCLYLGRLKVRAPQR